MFKNYTELSRQDYETYRKVCDSIALLRDNGWAVVVITADEVGGVDVDRLVDGLYDDAIERIAYLKEPELEN